MSDWVIEYEIPPMRAIYRCECAGSYSEENVRKAFEIHYPNGRIRKLTKSKDSTISAQPKGEL